MSYAPQMDIAPMTRTVKRLIILNVALWVGLILIGQNFIFHNDFFFQTFGLVPYRVITEFWIWQPFTYGFLHSQSVFHVIFNMLSLWWFGSELEVRWGSRFFVFYYLLTGWGAAIFYLVCVFGYSYITGNVGPMTVPVVGASGSIFGLLLAYGMLFGERPISFMMLFPMKAKHFVMLIGVVELLTLMDSGSGQGVANLAHLGGLVSGYLVLFFVARWRTKMKSGGSGTRGRRLKLVVDNERKDTKSKTDDGPRYWN
jgi:membrane associated rhomboid family serine protease